MQRHDITLLGRSYSISCEPGEETRLETLAGYVDSKLRKLQAGQTTINEARLFVLAALTLADELFDARAEIAEVERKSSNLLNEEEDVLLAAISHLKKRVDGLANGLMNA